MQERGRPRCRSSITRLPRKSPRDFVASLGKGCAQDVGDFPIEPLSWRQGVDAVGKRAPVDDCALISRPGLPSLRRSHRSLCDF